MKFEFKRLILPIFLLLLLVGIIFGVASYNSSKKMDGGNTQTQTEAIFEQVSPSSDIETDQSSIKVSGKTTSGKDQVFVNGKKISINKNGEFDTEISLNNGENEILFEAVSPNNVKEQKRIKITKREAKAPEVKPQTPSTTNPNEGTTNVTPESGQLTDTGPKENTTFAFSVLILLTFYWLKSRKKLKKC